ncbi:MAG TPA: hypothetical protein ENL03_05035, partial [Phycisphaerae bacterium]|nr:hypothetical protein [Phycisphaerae bacterium]
FQLLIFFLVTAHFIPPEGQLPGTVPKIKIEKPDPTPASPSQTIKLVALGEFNNDVQYQILETETICPDPESLCNELKDYAKTVRGDKDFITITIDPSYNACWGFVVEAYNQAVRAGYKNIGMAPVR